MDGVRFGEKDEKENCEIGDFSICLFKCVRIGEVVVDFRVV